VGHCLFFRRLSGEGSFYLEEERRIVRLDEDFCCAVEERIKFVVLKGSLIK
jgi:hypothetical protein